MRGAGAGGGRRVCTPQSRFPVWTRGKCPSALKQGNPAGAMGLFIKRCRLSRRKAQEKQKSCVWTRDASKPSQVQQCAKRMAQPVHGSRWDRHVQFMPTRLFHTLQVCRCPAPVFAVKFFHITLPQGFPCDTGHDRAFGRMDDQQVVMRQLCHIIRQPLRNVHRASTGICLCHMP